MRPKKTSRGGRKPARLSKDLLVKGIRRKCTISGSRNL